MFYPLFLFCILVLFCLHKYKQPLMAPVSITFLIWTALIFLYQYLPTNLYPLTDLFYVILFLFLLFYLLGHIFSIICFGNVTYKNEYYEDERKLKLSIYFCILISLYQIYRYIAIYRSGVNVYIMSVKEGWPTDLRVINYINVFCIALYFYILSKKKKMQRIELLYIFLFTIAIGLRLAKLGVMQLFCGMLAVLWIRKKIKFRHLILLSAIIIVLLFVLTIIREEHAEKGTDLIVNIFAVYALSPLKAADLLFNGEVNIGHHRFFGFVFRVLSKLFKINFDFPKEEITNFVYVPVPTNVYTIMDLIYTDFGLLGTIFYAFLLGLSWGTLYRYKNNPHIYMIYIINIYTIFFQFFDDIIINYFSVFLQGVIFSWCLLKILKVNCINIERRKIDKQYIK